jgi:hypothetical protein
MRTSETHQDELMAEQQESTVYVYSISELIAGKWYSLVRGDVSRTAQYLGHGDFVGEDDEKYRASEFHYFVMQFGGLSP